MTSAFPFGPARALLLALISGSLLVLLCSGTGAIESSPAKKPNARPKVDKPVDLGTCLGRPVDVLVTRDGGRVRIRKGRVIRVTGTDVTVVGPAFSRICGDWGNQVIIPGRGRTLTSAGPGDDVIRLSEGSHRNVVFGGPGNDRIVGSRGNDTLIGGPGGLPANVPDRDTILGEGGNDELRDNSGEVNQLFGGTGVDYIRSVGSAVSILNGGTGSDFLFSNGGLSRSGAPERLFGERGNDRLNAALADNRGPAFLDGGAGDDWLDGSPSDDTIIFHSGIKKVNAGAGDDLLIGTSRGSIKVEGGPGTDNLSFAAHTPPDGSASEGVLVNLGAGFSRGVSRYQLSGIEDVTGSSFDDRIFGAQGSANALAGGAGDDFMGGNRGDGDSADGGPGENRCIYFDSEVRCDGESPGRPGAASALVEIDQSGVLTVIGSPQADRLRISWDQAGRFLVATGPDPVADGLCVVDSPGIVGCPAPRYSIRGVIVYGSFGDDEIRIDDSVPMQTAVTMNGGTGANALIGGRSGDFISAARGSSAGSVMRGRGGPDVIWLDDDVIGYGGGGSDLFGVANPCYDGSIVAGKGRDNIVFAGSTSGVVADIEKGFARRVGGCPAGEFSLARDIEGLEGSNHDDYLRIGLPDPSQDAMRGLLGRGGEDVLDSRNGVADSVTVGDGGRRNTVVSDPFDTVHWDWGLSGF